MRDEPLDKMTVRELRELEARVDRHIAIRQNEERMALREQLKALAEEAGFTLAEVLSGGKGGKGRTAAAKYANPDNPSETWSGRGRQPRWMVAKLKQGGKQTDFAI